MRNNRLSASKNKQEMSKRNGRRGHGRGGGGPRSRRAVVADDSGGAEVTSEAGC